MVNENTPKNKETAAVQTPVSSSQQKNKFWNGFWVGGLVGGIVVPVLLAFLLLAICL